MNDFDASKMIMFIFISSSSQYDVCSVVSSTLCAWDSTDNNLDDLLHGVLPSRGLDKSLSPSAQMPCVPLSSLGCAFETHHILELTLLGSTPSQPGGGERACSKRFGCLRTPGYSHLLSGFITHSFNLPL